MNRYLVTFFLCAISFFDIYAAPNPMEIPLKSAEISANSCVDYRIDLDPVTGLPKARFDYHYGALRQRHFYTYHPALGTTEEIIDNGSSEEESSLTAVSARRIIRFSSLGNAPGICSMVEEFNLDPISGQSTLVQRMFNIHNDRNLLVQQDVFSPEKKILGSWSYTYDVDGQLIDTVDLVANSEEYTNAESQLERTRRSGTPKTTSQHRLAFEYPYHVSKNDGGPRLFDFLEPTRHVSLLDDLSWSWTCSEERRLCRCRELYDTYWTSCQALSKPHPDYVDLRWSLIQKWWQPLEGLRNRWSDFITMMGTDFDHYEPYSRLKAKAYDLPEYGELLWDWDYRQGFAIMAHVLNLVEEDGGNDEDCKENLKFYRSELANIKQAMLPQLDAFEKALIGLHARMKMLDPSRYAILARYRQEFYDSRDQVLQEELLAFWDAAIESQPGHPLTNRWRGMTLANQGDYDLAAPYLADAIATRIVQSSRYKKLRAEIHQEFGFLHLQNNAYEDALKALNQSIGFNPYLDLAYLYRAASYFETAQFDAAINDYRALRAMGFHPPEIAFDETIQTFSVGLRDGLMEGMEKAIVEIIPSLYSTISGMGQFCWAIKDSQYRTWVASQVADYFDYMRNLDPETLKQNLTHVLYQLVETWDKTPPRERGHVIGTVIGHFGVDILMPAAFVKRVKAVAHFQQLKKANLIATLHEISAESTQAKLLLEKSLYSQKFYAQALNMNYPGRLIAGAGHAEPIRDLPRLITLYGGTQVDWAKKSSGTFNVIDLFGKRPPKVYLHGENPGWYSHVVSCHWYENITTGVRYEIKTKIHSLD